MKLANLCKKFYKSKPIVETLSGQKLSFKINPDNTFFKNLNKDGFYGSILKLNLDDVNLIKSTENSILLKKELENYFKEKKIWDKKNK